MSGPSGIPVRPLAALSATVLVAHLLLLQSAPALFETRPPMPSPTWVTRTIVLNPPPEPAAAAESPAPPAPPVPAPRPRPVRPPATPISEQNPPATPTQQAPTATNPIAESTPAGPPAAAPEAAASAPAPVPAPVAEASPPPPAPSPPRPERKPQAATAFAVPGSVRLLFNVVGENKKQHFDVRGELLWLHDGSSYSARMEVSVFLLGSRIQTSTGRIGAEGLAPARFGDKSRREFAAHFQRDKGVVTFSANTPEAPLLAGAQDRLSVFLQLGAMLAGEPARYPVASTITLQIVGPRDADTWLFTVEGEEALNLKGTEYKTLKLIRNPRREHDQKVEVWFAPELGYLPVRMRLTQPDGDFADQQLRGIEKP